MIVFLNVVSVRVIKHGVRKPRDAYSLPNIKGKCDDFANIYNWKLSACR